MLLIMTGWISLYKIGWEDFFKLIFFKILDYLHLYNKYLGMGLKSTHKIHLYFIEPSNTYLKVIIYSIFFFSNFVHEARFHFMRFSTCGVLLVLKQFQILDAGIRNTQPVYTY